VRRLHDRNKSGWWAALYLLPFVGWLWLVIECGILPGRPSRWAAEDPEPFVAPEIEEGPAPSPAATRTVGTVQRRDYRALDGKLLMKIARSAVGIALAALVGYMVLHAMPDDLGTFSRPGKTKTIE
jgi:hypothetical protein